ncbi:Cathepsin L [Amphibalanus amphitrite]|uniref:Cathepsin L n=1 Tax=Amphibalanus amphitrite TaxID=1232801 RepID=A0A6A4VG00_AMPAM|nr:Cathepsin L [Amphibalanus amphitrite]
MQTPIFRTEEPLWFLETAWCSQTQMGLSESTVWDLQSLMGARQMWTLGDAGMRPSEMPWHRPGIMKVLLVIALAQLAVGFELTDPDWVAFKSAHGKAYSHPAEEAARLAIFKDNQRLIAEHNAGNHSFKLGVNKFADLTNAEYRQLFGHRMAERRGLKASVKHLKRGVTEATVDWRDYGVVTPVKDQGIYGNTPCGDGLASNAFEYLVDEGGIMSEADYPSTMASYPNCNYDPAQAAAKISSWVQISEGDESELEDAVANVGPIAIRTDASHFSFQLYSRGVYNEPHCSSSRLDHAMLVVGYGTESGQDYWLVKNSWGTGWGLSGYIKMSRNAGNQCGVATDANYPLP